MARRPPPWARASLATAGVTAVVLLLVFAGPTCSSSPNEMVAPRLVFPDASFPVASHERGTPPETLATIDQYRPSWRLGLRLHETRLDPDWKERRAKIEVLRREGATGSAAPDHEPSRDVRDYAIGDLLPFGSILVGISTATVQLLVADAELVSLNDQGQVVSLQDFRAAYEAPRLKLARQDAAYQQALLEVVAYLRSSDADEVQGAIDALIEAGPAAVATLVPYAESVTLVATSTFTFGGGTDVRQPQVFGDLIVGVLEAITGHSFGDPMASGYLEEDRRWIRRQWARWLGVAFEERDLPAIPNVAADASAVVADVLVAAAPVTGADAAVMDAATSDPIAAEVDGPPDASAAAEVDVTTLDPPATDVDGPPSSTPVMDASAANESDASDGSLAAETVEPGGRASAGPDAADAGLVAAPKRQASVPQASTKDDRRAATSSTSTTAGGR